jgi:lipoate-protein ligase B
MYCQIFNPTGLNYLEIWDLQNKIANSVAIDKLDQTVLILEHEHVYTIGKRGKLSDILFPEDKLIEKDINIHWIDRGGQITYHGPGQLILYPILNIVKLGLNPHEYIRLLEKLAIMTLNEFDINAYQIPGLTGVWIDNAKIASIGIKITRGVTTHGLAINVNPDLSYFEGIIACGALDQSITSMQHYANKLISVNQIIPSIIDSFSKIFAFNMRLSSKDISKELNNSVNNYNHILK